MEGLSLWLNPDQSGRYAVFSQKTVQHIYGYLHNKPLEQVALALWHTGAPFSAINQSHEAALTLAAEVQFVGSKLRLQIYPGQTGPLPKPCPRSISTRKPDSERQILDTLSAINTYPQDLPILHQS